METDSTLQLFDSAGGKLIFSDGAELFIIPLHRQHGLPCWDDRVEATSPCEVELYPRQYLIVAVKDGMFHEVIRTVPIRRQRQLTHFLNDGFRRIDGVIALPSAHLHDPAKFQNLPTYESTELLPGFHLTRDVYQISHYGNQQNNRPKSLKSGPATFLPYHSALNDQEAMGMRLPLVFDDVDVERTVNGCLWGGFSNSGQTCTAIDKV